MLVTSWIVLVVLAQGAPAATGEASMESSPAETAKEQAPPAPADQSGAAPARSTQRETPAQPAPPATVSLAQRREDSLFVRVSSTTRRAELWHERRGEMTLACAGSCGMDLPRVGRYEIRVPDLGHSSDSIWLMKFREQVLIEVSGPNQSTRSAGVAGIVVGGATLGFAVITTLVLAVNSMVSGFRSIGGCGQYGLSSCGGSTSAGNAWNIMGWPILISAVVGAIALPVGIRLFLEGGRVTVDVSGT